MLNTQTFPKWTLYLVIIFVLALLFVVNESRAQGRALIEEVKPQLQQLEDKVNKIEVEIKTKDKKIKDLEKELKERPIIGIISGKVTLDCSKYTSLFKRYDWDIKIAMGVVQAESGCRTDALSNQGDRGLFQINPVHTAKVNGNLDSLFDPILNTKIAYQIYNDNGWQAWSVCNKGIVNCY